MTLTDGNHGSLLGVVEVQCSSRFDAALAIMSETTS